MPIPIDREWWADIARRWDAAPDWIDVEPRPDLIRRMLESQAQRGEIVAAPAINRGAA